MATKRVKTNGQPTAVPLQIVRPENYPSLYVNNVQFSASQWDIRLDFGEIQTPPPGAPSSSQLVIQKIGVILTPAFAKVVAQTLTFLVEQHEKTITQLPAWTPPEKS